MRKLLKVEHCFYVTIFCLPLYLVRFTVFGAPTNALEALALISITSLLLTEPKLVASKIKRIPKIVIFTSLGIIFGLLFSIFFNHNYQTGLGILKGWFLLPMLFAVSLYSIANTQKILEKILLSYFF